MTRFAAAALVACSVVAFAYPSAAADPTATPRPARGGHLFGQDLSASRIPIATRAAKPAATTATAGKPCAAGAACAPNTTVAADE